jgi:glutamine--fructose-6-phosphate transaminase
VVAIRCCEKLKEKIMSNVEQVISRGAQVLLITNMEDVPESEKLSVIRVQPVNELFSPSLSVVILQLLSYYVAVNRGLDIDKPRNLAKSVTVE